MDILAAIAVFTRVAENSSFSAVAREFGSTQSQVSKQIAALERRLGARLLNRTTRNVALTDEGRVYLGFCRQILDAVSEADAGVGASKGQPMGLVRLSSPYAFARRHLAPRLPALLRRFPLLRVELVASDVQGDMVEQGIDVAIRFGDLSGDMVVRRIGTTARVTVAAPDYLKQAGEPASLADLASHNCIVYTNLASGNTWSFAGPNGFAQIEVRGNLATNSSEVIKETALGGIGIAVMPDWLFCDELLDGSLKRILRNYEPEPLPIHLVHVSRRYVPPKIRAVIDYLATELSRDPAFGSALITNRPG